MVKLTANLASDPLIGYKPRRIGDEVTILKALTRDGANRLLLIAQFPDGEKRLLLTSDVEPFDG
ncbi:MAG: hypothetical protein KGJ90_03850 [Patescibacteria group bacterium]|nr:hypothetical protein [Patescibacteria group bacterium]